MAKNPLRKIEELIGELRTTVVRYPVELIMALCASAAAALAYHDVTCPVMGRAAVLSPLFFTLAFILNTSHSRRSAYLLAWLAIIPLAFIGGIEHWIETSQYRIAVAVLCPLAVMISRRRRDNDAFTDDLLAYAVSAAAAMLFAVTAHLLFWATVASTAYVFDFRVPSHLWFYTALVIYGIMAPMLFLTFQNRLTGTRASFGRLGTTLINAVVTPALLIYAAVMYLYIMKIVVMWELPKGGVAYMVFAFTIVATATGAVQYALDRRLYDPFFRRFGLISLPMLVLFWAGTARRVSEYGLSEWRIYLIICGAVMTVASLWPQRRNGRYAATAITAFVLFAAITCLPPLSAERLARNSQMRRIRSAAAEIGALDSGGRLVIGDRSPADSVHRLQHRRICQSLDYIERDSAAMAELGLEKAWQYAEGLSPATAEYATAYRLTDTSVETVSKERTEVIYSSGKTAEYDISRFGTLFTDPDVAVSENGDSIRISHKKRLNLVILTDKLLEAQFAKIGCSVQEPPSAEKIESCKESLLVYETDSATVIFTYLSIAMRADGMRLNGADVDAVMVER